MVAPNGEPSLAQVCAALHDRCHAYAERIRYLEARVAQLEQTEEEHMACLRHSEYMPSPHAAGWGG